MKHLSALVWFVVTFVSHAYMLYIFINLEQITFTSLLPGTIGSSTVYLLSLIFALGQGILAAVLSYLKSGSANYLAILIPILALDILYYFCLIGGWGKAGLALPYLVLATYFIRRLVAQEP